MLSGKKLNLLKTHLLKMVFLTVSVMSFVLANDVIAQGADASTPDGLIKFCWESELIAVLRRPV